VATVGGQEAFNTAIAVMLDDARVWRLAEMCKRRKDDPGAGDRQMGVSVARAPQIERGDVST